MRVHLCQTSPLWQDRPANHAAARAMITAAEPDRGDLVVLPEMFCVGFSMDVAVTHDADGATERFVCETAGDFGIYLIAGNVTRPDALGRNEALVAGPAGTLVARYHKLHPFRFAGEHEHFRGGDGVVTFEWNAKAPGQRHFSGPAGVDDAIDATRVAPFVCYDLRFPEVFRLAAKQGAEVMVVIANWPTPRVGHWLALLTARAIENQAYVVGVNRTGRDPNLDYPGRSVVIDPQGRVVVDAGAAVGAVAATLDLAELRAYRARFPALADLRFI